MMLLHDDDGTEYDCTYDDGTMMIPLMMIAQCSGLGDEGRSDLRERGNHESDQ